MKGIREKRTRETSAQVKVDCYGGYKANERPVTLSLGKKRLRVTDILDQWHGPGYSYFKILAEDANIYILRYSEAYDVWNVVYFKDEGYHGEISSWMQRDASA